MRKVIICLLALYFLVEPAVYAAGPSAGYGGSRGGNSGSGKSYDGSGYGGRSGGYSGSGNSYRGSPGGSHGGSNNYHGNGGYHGYHGSGGYHGYRGYHGGRPYHGKGSHHHGGGNSYRIWIGGSWYPGYWGSAYPRYYSYYYSYPSYDYPYAYAPGVVAEQPQLSAPAQEEDSYWYYCENPQGYYPYVKSCPGGWMKVVPETAPPDSP